MGSLTLLIALLCIPRFGDTLHAEESNCPSRGDSTRTLHLSIVSRRNQSDLWSTDFTAKKDDSNIREPNDITLDISHSVKHCNGKRTVQIHGVMADLSTNPAKGVTESLLFHSKCGSNVAITNDGLTLQKINLNEAMHSVAFTNRPLRIDEIFEVRLDKKSSIFKHSLGIGVTTYPPEQIESIPKHINFMRPPSWVMYHGNSYHNGSEALLNYGKNLDTLSVGDRAGVKRSRFGSLHYLVNGIDQGPVASNVPYPVYGLLELRESAVQATIVGSS